MARNLKVQKDVFDVENIGKPITRNSQVRTIQPSNSPAAVTASRQSSRLATPSKKPQRKAEDSDDDFVLSVDIDSADDDTEDEIVEAEDEDDYEEEQKKSKKSKSKSKKQVKKPTNKPSQSKGLSCHKPLRKRKSDRNDRIQQLFKSGAVVEPLPGRSDEFSWIKRTVSGLLESGLGGCLCKSLPVSSSF